METITEIIFIGLAIFIALLIGFMIGLDCGKRGKTSGQLLVDTEELQYGGVYVQFRQDPKEFTDGETINFKVVKIDSQPKQDS